MAKFFKVPFAMDGDKTAIPNDEQIDDAVSYDQGWTPPYAEAPESPTVRYPERDKMNSLMYEITLALQQYQTMGFPDFITTSDNGGVPYPYSLNAYVRYDDGSGFAVYWSLVDNNESLPTDTTKWGRLTPSTIPVGVVWDIESSTLPTGWVWANGTTIGNATSGATGRANADTVSLFTLIWNEYNNTLRPIQNSDGTPGTRGVSAAADFAASKRLPVSDRRGRIGIGKDDMGGAAAADRITSAGSGITGIQLGSSGGAQSVILTEAQLAAHTHGNNLSVGSTALTINQVPGHRHYTVAQGIGSADTPLVDENKTVWRQNNGGGAYRLIGENGNDAVYSPTSLPYASSAASGHTHSLAGSISAAGSSQAHLNVQPGIITNYIQKL